MKNAPDANDQTPAAQLQVEQDQADADTSPNAANKAATIVPQMPDYVEIPVDNNEGPDARPIRGSGPNLTLYAAILPPLFATSAWLIYMLFG